MKIIINNKIYDITTFIQEHPGGPDVFITGGGGGGANANLKFPI
jgi:cytochrome b involved in lipid metabolism